ncbi:odorant receptor 13a-like isoform X2 [Microplitis mediator]|uniref:odorant receptor 13a-like isoform X2 n=1 Tax=Microplitis mediator TaxID=375433 RepID=UPI0025537139|nr:odorant receptor 13a-like isoform X2 [Microplitis mediator]
MKKRGFAEYFWLNKFIMKSCGVIPLANNYFLVNLIITIMPFITSGFLAIPAAYTLLFNWKKLNSIEKANIFSDHVELIVAIIKAILPQRQKLIKLTQMCSELWEDIDYDHDYQKICNFADGALRITYGFTFIVVFALISILMVPAITDILVIMNSTTAESKQLPYSTGYFHDIKNSFNIWYGLQIIAGFISITQILAPDTSYVFLTFHGCVHARICQLNYSKIKRYTINDEEQSSISWNFMLKCIHRHQKILEYAHLIEGVFSLVILIQMLLSITTICIFGFNLLFQDAEKMKYAIHLFGAVVQLLFFCWPAQDLQNETIAVADAVYDLPWMDWSKKDRQIIEIIIARSQNFAKITVGKFSVISIETFSSTLSTAVSFFSVLRHVV